MAAHDRVNFATNDETFISNIYDPNMSGAFGKLVHPDYAKRPKTMKERDTQRSGPLKPAASEQTAYQYVLDWLRNKRIGEPVPVVGSEHSVEDLKAKGYVGVYHYRKDLEVKNLVPNQF